MTRLLSWVVTILMIVALFGGARIHTHGSEHASFHIVLGLATTLLLLLVHCWPLFYLVSLINAFVAAMVADGGHDQDIAMAKGLRTYFLLPSVITLVLGVAAPVLAFAQLRLMVPSMTHGALQAAVAFFHVVAWRRYLHAGNLLVEMVRKVKPSTSPSVS